MTESYTPMPLVVIVDGNDEDRASTRELLLNSGRVHIVGVAPEIEQMTRFMSAEPDVVLLDLGAVTGNLDAMIHHIRELCPRSEVVLTAAPDHPFELSDAVMAGARGLVRKPLAHSQLLGIIYRVYEAENLKRQHLEYRAKHAPEHGRSGEVIAVYSPKGGVGCTTIATNTAFALQTITDGKVVLVDFDLQFGDIDVLLDIHSSHGVHELMRSTDDLDPSILEAVMVKHRSGISVLLPPPTLDMVDNLTPEGLIAVLKALRKNFDFVIVDTWHAIEDITLAIMDLANTLLVVTTPEIPALRDTRRLLDIVEKRPEARNKTQIVVNRYPSRSAVSLANIERSLMLKPTGTIPSDGTLITRAVNEGVPFLSMQSEAANNMKQIAVRLAQHHRASQARGAAQQPGQGQAAQPAQSKKRAFTPFKRTQGAENPAQ